ncbi:MAG: PilZ domain-containing protein [Gammaproteobacteria bacterium]|nr:PilZ domain-containing protein [Gammaproteobacteria bacterium]
MQRSLEGTESVFRQSTQGLEVKEGWSELAPTDVWRRRDYLRFPLQVDAGLGPVKGESMPCVVEDFSAYGMRVRISGQASSDARVLQSQASEPSTFEWIGTGRGRLFAGEPVQIVLSLPGRRGRLRARASVRRIADEQDDTRVAIHYSRTSLDAYRCLLRVSDELSKLRCIAPVVEPVGEARLRSTAQRLVGSGQEMLLRLKERLRLHGECGRDRETVLPYLEGLGRIVDAEPGIVEAYLERLAEALARLAPEPRAATSTSVATSGAVSVRCEATGQRPAEIGIKLVESVDRCDGVRLLAGAFAAACAPLALPSVVTPLVGEVAEEIAALEWLRLQSLLEPSAIELGA